MHNHHDRTVKINKQQLIDKLTENKNAHIEEYKTAVKDYKSEAALQIKEASKNLKEDNFKKVTLQLIVPVDRTEEYDKVIEMFKWEVQDEVELTQSEFNEYVHDDNEQARSAKFSNSYYSSRN